MVIREAGILFRGFSLTSASYHKTSDGKIDGDLRNGLLTALVNFAESAFSSHTVEYFEMSKYIIAFIDENIKPADSPRPERIISYAILDKLTSQKKIEKAIHKVVQPSLKKIIYKFKSMYDGKNLSHISQFKNFKDELDIIFGSDTKTIDQKLKGTFFD
jgi:hypothetical protein